MVGDAAVSAAEAAARASVAVGVVRPAGARSHPLVVAGVDSEAASEGAEEAASSLTLSTGLVLILSSH